MLVFAAMELSVIVPCLNEEANVPELVTRIGEVFRVGVIDAELVLIDDGSTDGTWAAIEAGIPVMRAVAVIPQASLPG